MKTSVVSGAFLAVLRADVKSSEEIIRKTNQRWFLSDMDEFL